MRLTRDPTRPWNPNSPLVPTEQTSLVFLAVSINRSAPLFIARSFTRTSVALLLDPWILERFSRKRNSNRGEGERKERADDGKGGIEEGKGRQKFVISWFDLRLAELRFIGRMPDNRGQIWSDVIGRYGDNVYVLVRTRNRIFVDNNRHGEI